MRLYKQEETPQADLYRPLIYESELERVVK